MKRYIHKATQNTAVETSVDGWYFITDYNDGTKTTLPSWVIEMGDDWERDHEDGARVYCPLSQMIYTKEGDEWMNKNIGYKDFLVRRNIVTCGWYILPDDENIWTTMEGIQIPFSKVSQQHWSNIYHYHLAIGASRQVQIAVEQLAKNKWDLLPQNRF